MMIVVVSPVNQHFRSHLAFSSYTWPLILASPRWRQSWDSDAFPKGQFMICKFYFASVENRQDVAPSADHGSATNRRELRRSRLCFEVRLKILAALFQQRNTFRIGLAMESTSSRT